MLQVSGVCVAGVRGSSLLWLVQLGDPLRLACPVLQHNNVLVGVEEVALEFWSEDPHVLNPCCETQGKQWSEIRCWVVCSILMEWQKDNLSYWISPRTKPLCPFLQTVPAWVLF